MIHTEGSRGTGAFSVATGRSERICRRITSHHAKTFYFASHCLPRDVRRHAYAVYAFCRWVDDGVDGASSPGQAIRFVDHARRTLAEVYGSGPVSGGLSAFRETIRARSIPRDLFEALLDGMAMDLTISRYAAFPDLELYCYRVAGVVGLMMTYLFGFRHDRCLPRAVALGNAMQLTNILRDIREDLDRGRIYLPADEMDRFGISESQLLEGRVDEPFREFLRFQIARARALYRESDQGIPDLIGDSSRLTVRVMGRLYAGILDEIERNDFDVFRHRAHVSTSRKVRRLIGCRIQGWTEQIQAVLRDGPR